MTNPELFDVIELLVHLPEFELVPGIQGAIVECYDENHYEVEFSDQSGETKALCTLSPEQFVVVWRSQTKHWLPLPEKVTVAVSHLSKERQQQVLDFAYSLNQRRSPLPFPSDRGAIAFHPSIDKQLRIVEN
jgi:Domain of unknown function (DUF4926)